MNRAQKERQFLRKVRVKVVLFPPGAAARCGPQLHRVRRHLEHGDSRGARGAHHHPGHDHHHRVPRAQPTPPSTIHAVQ